MRHDEQADTDGKGPRGYWRLHLNIACLDKERVVAAKSESYAGVPFPTPRLITIQQHVTSMTADIAESRPAVAVRAGADRMSQTHALNGTAAAGHDIRADTA